MAATVVRGLDVELLPRSGPPIRTTVRSAAPVKGGLRVTLDRITSRNQSEALVGATVTVERDSLGPLKDGEYLDTDLVGLDVVTGGGEFLGRLEEVIATGANDVYVVRSAAGAEIMVPAVAHAVVGVDLAASRMTVNGEALEYSSPAPLAKADADRPLRKKRGAEHATASSGDAAAAPDANAAADDTGKDRNDR